MRRTLFLLPAILLAAVLSTSNGAPPGGVIRLATFSSSVSCWQAQVSINVLMACAPMYNQLVHFSPEDPAVIVGDGAESWEWGPDPVEWTFHLKAAAPGVSGIKLHNGTTLTSADAKFSLERAMGQVDGIANPSLGLLLNSYIQFVEAPNALTLRVTTEFPAPSLLANLASVHAALYPVALTVALPAPNPCQVIASGPFKCQEYTAGVVTKLERHADYFVPGRPYLDGVDVYVIADANTRLAAIKTGQIDVIPLGVTPSEAMGLESFGITMQEMTRNAALNLILNTTVPPFNDLRVRRAVNLALDRDAFVATQAGTKGGLMMPGGHWALPEADLLAREGYGDKTTERAQAQQLLADAGYPAGFPSTITTRSPSPYTDAADIVQQLLALVDVVASIEIVDTATYLNKLTGKTYEMAIDTVAQPLDDIDLMFLREYLPNAPENYTGLVDAQMDTLYSLQQQLTDPVARLTKAHELINETIDQQAFLNLYWLKRRVPVRNVVADFQAHPNLVQNLRWQDVWLTTGSPPTPTPTPIPSLSRWGILALAGLLGTLLIWRLNDRRKASA